MIVHYDPNLRLRQALNVYFDANAFGKDGGYNDTWVDFKLGPIPFPFPNTASRVRALRYHDLHHIVTGYDTTFAGELEISAWEIGAGCKDFVAAWVLNLAGMAGGLFRAPRRVFRAFVRGRRTSSLYGLPFEELLDSTVAAVRTQTGVDRASETATATDLMAFAAFSLAGLLVGLTLLPLAALLVPFGLLASQLRPAKTKAVTG